MKTYWRWHGRMTPFEKCSVGFVVTEGDTGPAVNYYRESGKIGYPTFDPRQRYLDPGRQGLWDKIKRCEMLRYYRERGITLPKDV